VRKDRFEQRWRRQQERGVRVERGPKRPSRISTTSLGIAARRFGLEVRSPAILAGRISTVEVTVRRREHETEARWHATLEAPWIPEGFALSAESVLSEMKKSITGEDILTFDELFDRWVSVRGRTEEAIAILDHGARRRILELLPRELRVKSGRIHLVWTTRKSAIPSDLCAKDLRVAVALARRLSIVRGAFVDRLAENAKREPHARVALRNLALLLGRKRGLDVSPMTRAEIMRITTRALLDARRASAQSMAEIAFTETALFALAFAGATARELDALPEPALINLLGIVKGREKVQFASALGRVGGENALPCLVPLASGIFVRGALKHAVREAVASIEARAGRDRGQLSLAVPGEGGALAFAPRTAGDLALARDADDSNAKDRRRRS
jgi:hypothetical protein